MIAVGATVDDLRTAQRLLRDPEVTFYSPTLTAAWGRRPG
jgi:hypothetical protein